MNFIINNWYIILALVAVLGVAAWYVYRYFNLPSEAQLAKVREVYDLFVTRFPWLARVVPFDLFSSMVDDALEDMREMLKNNQAVKAHVNGEGGGNE